MSTPLLLDGSALSIADVTAVALDRRPVHLDAGARERMASAHNVLEQLMATGDPIYGVTTGFGALADTTIPAGERTLLQRRVVLSHAAGVGSPLPAEVVRAMLLLRARSLSAGLSGVRPQLIDSMLALLNSDVVPAVPSHGSLGASGDLAPLAHVAAVLLGYGEVVGPDESILPAGDALAAAGLVPVDIEAKEGLALINGTDAMTAMLVLIVGDLEQLLVAADCAAAMVVEAALGTVAVFDPDVIALRPAPGQQASAANIRALLDGSPIVASHRPSKHAVQDAYSLRCAPQVHGAARDLLAFARATATQELHSVVDNPVILSERGEMLSTGNFHGQALAYAADCCAMLCADIASISERRIDRLLDPDRSRGLPAFLVRESGLNSGLMIAQYTAAALVTALRAAATPFSVQSIPTSAGQEDHVSMGFEGMLRTRESVERLRHVIAIELVCAAQALDLRHPLQPAAGTGALRASLREHVAFLDEDRVLAPDLAAAAEWLGTGTWRTDAETAAGTLQ